MPNSLGEIVFWQPSAILRVGYALLAGDLCLLLLDVGPDGKIPDQIPLFRLLFRDAASG